MLIILDLVLEIYLGFVILDLVLFWLLSLACPPAGGIIGYFFLEVAFF